MPRKRLLLWLVVALPALLGMSGDCDSADCTPTTTEATRADKLDLTAASRSAVLEARLTADDKPLAGKTLRFAVLADGAEVFFETAATGADGKARIDLKQVRLDALQAIVRGDQFRATFGGDSTYCSSADDADFRVLKVP
jgi:hypothetical protein